MKVALTQEQFTRLRVLLAQTAGLVFDDARRESMAYSIAERMRSLGLRDVAGYLARLDDPAERQLLVDEVTIQETHFFRNPPQVRALRLHVLPELLRHAEAHGRRLRIWSAGCSTGEEPYTVAMLLRELLPSTDGWDVKVIATDVSSRAIAAARTGRYGARAVQLATAEELARHFVDAPDGGHEVRPEVRELVEFRHHNLVTEAVPFVPSERIDLVLCRNVTIYFGRETTRDLMSKIHHCLRDGGYLFLGHSETLWQVSEDFRLVALGTGESAAFVYRRVDKPSERRSILPDRRTADEGPPPPAEERRTAVRRKPAATVAQPVPDGDALQQAREALSAGRYAEAAQFAADAAGEAPLRAEAFYLRGLALEDLGRDEDALVELRKAVYLEPERGFAHFLLAGVLDRLGQPLLAGRAYGAAADTLGLQPADATAEELGGRSVRELAQLCRQLEHRLAGGQLESLGEEAS
jgi:chemotaxis protein methyltransferase CheR